MKRRVINARSARVRTMQTDHCKTTKAHNVIARDVFSVLVDNRRIEDNAGRG